MYKFRETGDRYKRVTQTRSYRHICYAYHTVQIGPCRGAVMNMHAWQRSTSCLTSHIETSLGRCGGGYCSLLRLSDWHVVMRVGRDLSIPLNSKNEWWMTRSPMSPASYRYRPTLRIQAHCKIQCRAGLALYIHCSCNRTWRKFKQPQERFRPPCRLWLQNSWTC